MNEHKDWRLDAREAELLASNQFPDSSVVSVMSIVCNWGPPISGRFDSDYLDVWIAADESLQPKSIVLHGCESASWEGDRCAPWRDVGECIRSKSVDLHGRAVGIYRFSGQPIDQFVVRLTDGQGNQHYDNNGGYGINYRLHRYRGLQLNCVRTSNQVPFRPDPQESYDHWLLVFPRLVRIEGQESVARVSMDER